MTEYTDKMLIVPVLTKENNKQARVPKNMILDLEWFNGDRIKCEN